MGIVRFSQNSYLHAFSKQHRLLVETEEPLEVRAALAGGRTEVFMPFCRLSDHEIQAGVRIRHIDVVCIFFNFKKPDKISDSPTGSSPLWDKSRSLREMTDR